MQLNVKQKAKYKSKSHLIQIKIEYIFKRGSKFEVKVN